MFDKEKPFNEVTGSTGVKFMQAGKCFLQSGHECDPDGNQIEDAPKSVSEEDKAKMEDKAKAEEGAKAKKEADDKVKADEKIAKAAQKSQAKKAQTFS